MTVTEQPVKPVDPVVTTPPEPEVAIRKFLEETLDSGVKPDIIGVHPVGNDCFRVNIWTKEFPKDGVVPRIRLPHSYYVEVTPGGEVIDRTIRKDSD